MDYNRLVMEIFPTGADFNPAAFEFSENEAREKKLWRDPKPMPTREELKAALKNVEKSLNKEKIKDRFNKLKDHWQEIYDDFSTDNELLGLSKDPLNKFINDQFRDAFYYINANSPELALAALDYVTIDDKYCTNSVIDSMKLKLNRFMEN
jgi:hypothetical protein